MDPILLSQSRMNLLLSTMNKTSTLRRSARLLAVQGGESQDGSRGVQTFKRKRAAPNDIYVTNNGKYCLPLELKSEPKDAPKKTRTLKSVPAVDVDPGYDNTGPSKGTKRHKRGPQPEPIYIIPDVERKETTFKGRLGYACLNTVLRNKKPSSDSVFCSRTCRLESLKKNGVDWVQDLGRKNVEDLLTVIQWNEDNNIRFFRLSSEIFPFASHLVHGYSLEYCADLLSKAGALANKYGHRLTTHPGQFTQLGSPKPAVVDAAFRELEYHCEMLDLMGIGLDGVIIVHGGGMYDDKTATLERIKQSILKLPQNVRNRLVLENDEMCYNAEDLLPLCEELDVPLVFDYHHDNLFPSSFPPPVIIERADQIWKRRGMKPKQHLSEQRPGAVTLMERRAHSDRCEFLPAALPDDMDLMIEAKDKEQAVLYLHRMYDLHPVIHASLRPANANPSKQTNGRKSSKRAHRKVSGEEDLSDAPDEDEAQLH
ncbi:UV-endonuclease UvdE [Phlegmacium glaucopus]|nr:UV-endonuclease UvdE [Phlegmacium glaucopus]